MKICPFGQKRSRTPAIPALGRLRQERLCESEAGLGCRAARLWPKQTKLNRRLPGSPGLGTCSCPGSGSVAGLPRLGLTATASCLSLPVRQPYGEPGIFRPRDEPHGSKAKHTAHPGPNRGHALVTVSGSGNGSGLEAEGCRSQHMPVIPPAWEAEAGRSRGPGSISYSARTRLCTRGKIGQHFQPWEEKNKTPGPSSDRKGDARLGDLCEPL